MGGSVALKGTDGAAAEAAARGAVPLSPQRALACMVELHGRAPEARIVAAAGIMGEDAARAAGFAPITVGTRCEHTTSAHTAEAAREMTRLGVGLILFAGGDGTARDLLAAIGSELPALGIPAGVKMHSAAFATSPRAAGAIAADFARGATASSRAEVMDIDEAAYRDGRPSASLFGFLCVPCSASSLQGGKAASRATDESSQREAARAAAEIVRRADGEVFFIGTGSTTAALMRELGMSGTLLGVDMVVSGDVPHLAATDMSERDILAAIRDTSSRARIVVTPIGGQGFLFGRGDQQFSPAVIRTVGRDGIVVLSAETKLAALHGRPLLVDTGDPSLDDELSGTMRVETAPGRCAMYRVASA